jgi:hypothetical protein
MHYQVVGLDDLDQPGGRIWMGDIEMSGEMVVE